MLYDVNRVKVKIESKESNHNSFSHIQIQMMTEPLV